MTVRCWVTFTWPASDEVDAFAMEIGDPVSRLRMGQSLASRYPKAEWLVIVHSTTYVGSGVKLARGVVICVATIAAANIEVGEFAQLNLGCTVGHEAKIGPECLSNPGANISGGVELGRSVTMGTGAKILQYVRVGDEARVGAGAVVTCDVPAGTTVGGARARSVARVLNEKAFAVASTSHVS